jgi:hypothetical protein
MEVGVPDPAPEHAPWESLPLPLLCIPVQGTGHILGPSPPGFQADGAGHEGSRTGADAGEEGALKTSLPLATTSRGCIRLVARTLLHGTML